MLSHFFLKRPVFAWVISIALMAAGLLAQKAAAKSRRGGEDMVCEG